MTKLLLFFLLTIAFTPNRIDKVKQHSTKQSQSSTHQNPPILWTADYSPDGKYYAVGGNDSVLNIYDASQHRIIFSANLGGSVQCLDWNNDSQTLAIAIDHRPAQILNLTNKKFITLEGITGSRALDWNPDGSMLAVGDYEGALFIFSKDGKRLHLIDKGNTKTLLSVEWHPTKDLVLTTSENIRIFDLTGKILLNIKHRKEETAILTAQWHPSGNSFATGDYGHVEENIESLLQLWKADGTLIKSLSGSKAEYRNIRWNKTGTVLATASDGIRLWSRDGALLAKAKTPALLWGIDWNNDNTRIVTSSMKGEISIWNDKAQLLKSLRFEH